MKLKVTCYDGHQGEEKPQRFELGDNKIEVKNIVDQWLSTDYRYFKIIGNDDSTYIIRHDLNIRIWELVMYCKKGTGGFQSLSFKDA
ncbi:MAG: hypothetical protein K9L30_10900 [Desulfobacterales bacterium]|nr:hypothetical protein [Desulfobacterales bacterium]